MQSSMRSGTPPPIKAETSVASLNEEIAKLIAQAEKAERENKEANPLVRATLSHFAPSLTYVVVRASAS